MRTGSFHPIVFAAVALLVVAVVAAVITPAILAKRREGSERNPAGMLRELASVKVEPQANKEYAGYFIRRYGRIYVAYPSNYKVNGRRTFVLGEDGKIWCKDTGGVPVETLPADPAQSGWTIP